MAENAYVNKVVFDGAVVMDSSQTTVTPETLATGVTALDATGTVITGNMQAGASQVKRWDVNALNLAGGAYKTILTDPWLAEHREDPELCIAITHIGVDGGYASIVANNTIGYFIQSNAPVTAKGSNSSQVFYGGYTYAYISSGYGYYGYNRVTRPFYEDITSPHLRVTTDGNLQYYGATKNSTNVVTGTYYITGNIQVIAWVNQ